MSGVFKSLKDLFIESDGEPKKEPTSTIEQVEEVVPDMKNTASATTSIPLPSGDTAGEVNEKFLDLLFGVLEENNLKGFDYLEYKKSLQQLKKMDMDEQTQFQSAFATASTIGATKQILLDSAQVYLNILDKEDKKFNDAWKHQAENQIGGLQNRKVELEKGLSEKKAMIQKLNEEIEQHEAELAKMDDQLSQVSHKVNKTKNDFVSSYNYLVDQLKYDIEKMKLYLK